MKFPICELSTDDLRRYRTAYMTRVGVLRTNLDYYKESTKEELHRANYAAFVNMTLSSITACEAEIKAVDAELEKRNV